MMPQPTKVLMADQTHNGWSNYWTWKANLEFEDAINTLYTEGAYEKYEPTEIGDQLKEYIENWFSEATQCELTEHWLICVVEEINFREIVFSMLRDDDRWDNESETWI